MKYSKEFKLQLGLTESASDADVDAHLAALQAAGDRLKTAEAELVKEKASRAEAENAAAAALKARLLAENDAKVDALLREGKITGNATDAVRKYRAALVTGDVKAADVQAFDAVLAALPKFDTERVASDVKPASQQQESVTLDDFKKAATDNAAARRITAAVEHRRANGSPKFTARDLEAELSAKK